MEMKKWKMEKMEMDGNENRKKGFKKIILSKLSHIRCLTLKSQHQEELLLNIKIHRIDRHPNDMQMI